MKKIEICIADDHTMFLEGISALLKTEKDISIIGTATNGKSILEILENKLPDVLLLDINMPEMDGIEVAKLIKQQHSAVKILIISTSFATQTVAKLMRIGVEGYLLKNAEKSELVHAIIKLSQNQVYYCSEIENIYDQHLHKLKSEEVQITELSSREKEILILIAQEFTGNEIAEKANISLNTVSTHRRNLLSKLNVKNSAGLVKYAIENGLLD